MTRILLLTAEQVLANVTRELAQEKGWELSVLPIPPEGDGPVETFDLVIVDARPAPGSLLSFSVMLGFALQPRWRIHARRQMSVGNYEEAVGRMSSFVSGGSGFLRIHAYGNPPEPDLKTRLATSVADLLAMPVYEVKDFHHNFSELGFYRQALESMQVPVVILSGEGTILLMNLRALAQFDYPTHMVIDQDWSMLVAPRDRGRHAREVLQHIASGYFYECSLRFVDRHGREFPSLLTSGRVFPNPSIILTIQDLTQVEVLQRQLLTFQRMEAVERVVAGMTHEFNNLLTAILGHAEMLAHDLPAGTEYQSSAEIIRRQAETARQLTDRLLGLSGSRQFMPGLVSCSEIVRNTLSLMARSLDKRIRVETDLTENGDIVEGDSGQLQQVLVNLCLNARDAIKEDGLIRISTLVREITPEECRLHQDWSPGMFVEIATRDTGCGMTPAVLEHMFEPFFTTKPVGSGTGLGLSVVRGIVRNHGGHVAIESTPGVGTTIFIRIPQSQGITAPPAPGSAGQSQPAALPRGMGGILVVDDDRTILIYAQRVLERAGYKLWLANNGTAALDLFDRHREEIAAIIVDMIMPVIPGREVIRQIRERDADTPIIVCTGFAPGGVDDTIVGAVQGFLRKPYRQADLLELVHEVTMG